MDTSFNAPEVGFGTVMGLAIGGLMDDLARNRMLKAQAAEAARIARIQETQVVTSARREVLAQRVIAMAAELASKRVEVHHLQAEIEDTSAELRKAREENKRLLGQFQQVNSMLAELEAA